MNRVVAFLGPLFALAAGGAAAWLGQHFPGLEVETDSAAATIAAAVEFAAGAGVAGALQYRWLRGWQRWEEGGGGAPAGAPPGSGIGTGTIVAPAAAGAEADGPDGRDGPDGPDEPGARAGASPGREPEPEPELVPEPEPEPEDVPRLEDTPRPRQPVPLDDPFAPIR